MCPKWSRSRAASYAQAAETQYSALGYKHAYLLALATTAICSETAGASMTDTGQLQASGLNGAAAAVDFSMPPMSYPAKLVGVILVTNTIGSEDVATVALTVLKCARLGLFACGARVIIVSRQRLSDRST